MYTVSDIVRALAAAYGADAGFHRDHVHNFFRGWFKDWSDGHTERIRFGRDTVIGVVCLLPWAKLLQTTLRRTGPAARRGWLMALAALISRRFSDGEESKPFWLQLGVHNLSDVRVYDRADCANLLLQHPNSIVIDVAHIIAVVLKAVSEGQLTTAEQEVMQVPADPGEQTRLIIKSAGYKPLENSPLNEN